jgi:hypothetical protein
MDFQGSFARSPSLLDDSLLHYPDVAEKTVLDAIRTWLRPECRVQRGTEDWRTGLSDAGVSLDSLRYFDLLGTLMHSTLRPLDTRCRCATDLTHDEASLLQVLGLLQRTRSEAATRLLNDWLPEPSVGGMLKLVRWFAIALLDAGLVIPVRTRHVSYMH